MGIFCYFSNKILSFNGISPANFWGFPNLNTGYVCLNETGIGYTVYFPNGSQRVGKIMINQRIQGYPIFFFPVAKCLLVGSPHIVVDIPLIHNHPYGWCTLPSQPRPYPHYSGHCSGTTDHPLITTVEHYWDHLSLPIVGVPISPLLFITSLWLHNSWTPCQIYIKGFSRFIPIVRYHILLSDIITNSLFKPLQLV